MFALPHLTLAKYSAAFTDIEQAYNIALSGERAMKTRTSSTLGHHWTDVLMANAFLMEADFRHVSIHQLTRFCDDAIKLGPIDLNKEGRPISYLAIAMTLGAIPQHTEQVRTHFADWGASTEALDQAMEWYETRTANFKARTRRKWVSAAAIVGGTVVAALTVGAIAHITPHGDLRRIGSTDPAPDTPTRPIALTASPTSPSQLNA